MSRTLLGSSLLLFLGACSSPAIVPMDAAVDAAPAIDAAGPPPPSAMTESGPVFGARGDGVAAFLGIPYAAPPIGDLRFRPPAPVTPWTEPRAAVRRPSQCPQFVTGLRLGHEDCLYLNVHRPDPMPDHAPVMVWFHGGGFVLGEGLQTDNGTAGDVLAREHGVIVVSMNYRLAQLGFLAHEALDAESGDHVSGNYGFLDQVAALEWVRDNIEAFGGDPANVTIFGESAGGESVCGHLVAPASRGLFHRAIIESGPCALRQPDLAAAEEQGTRFATALGCTSGDIAACLRAASEDDVLAALGAPPALIGEGPEYGQWSPITDGVVFTAPWMTSMVAGDVADVPVISGWNHDEGTIFMLLLQMTGGAEVTEANYRDTVASMVGEANADAIVARYPPSDFGGDARLAAARALGDGGLICPSRAAAIALREHVPVQTYLFAYPDSRFLLASDFPLGAFHQAEVQFVFGHPVGGAFPDGGDALHDAMAGYWTRFATDGHTDDATSVAWPAYDATGARLVLDRTIAASTDDYEDTCAFWRGITFD